MSVASDARFVVVGASLAGLQAAQALRRAGCTGDIVMVGDEPHYPYDRPPLSKQFLAGTFDEDKLRLRAAVDPAALELTWELGVAASGLDLERSQVALADGRSLDYDGLIIASGATARQLPNVEGPAIHVLRTLDDAIRLKAAFDAHPDRVCVVGAGFVGGEVAATARQAGLEVTMIEAAPAPLVRVLDHDAGMAVASLHRREGVDVRLGCGVSGIESTRDGAAVSLQDGSLIEADVVVVGIGAEPAVGWLADAGLHLDDGVVCDEFCSAAPRVVAAGDVCRWDHPRYGSIRIEQWDNAVDQGSYVARRLLTELQEAAGEEHDPEVAPYGPVPWFWSDQYDRKIQLAGRPASSVTIAQGEVEEGRFAQVYTDDAGQPTGVLAWNRPRQAIMARQLLEAEATLDEMLDKLGE